MKTSDLIQLIDCVIDMRKDSVKELSERTSFDNNEEVDESYRETAFIEWQIDALEAVKAAVKMDNRAYVELELSEFKK